MKSKIERYATRDEATRAVDKLLMEDALARLTDGRRKYRYVELCKMGVNNYLVIIEEGM